MEIVDLNNLNDENKRIIERIFHDLNNYLTIITTCIDLHKINPEQKHHLELASFASKKMAAYVSEKMDTILKNNITSSS